MVERGEVWWTYVGRQRGSNERKCRPVLVIQADEFNRSRIGTVVCVLITSDLRYVSAPGNVLAPAAATGLPRDTVVNVAQIVTLDRRQLSERVRLASPRLVEEVDVGLLKSLGLRAGEPNLTKRHSSDALPPAVGARALASIQGLGAPPRAGSG